MGRISNGLIISPQKVKKVSSYDTHEKLVLSSLPHTQWWWLVGWVGLEGWVWVVLVVHVCVAQQVKCSKNGALTHNTAQLEQVDRVDGRAASGSHP